MQTASSEVKKLKLGAFMKRFSVGASAVLLSAPALPRADPGMRLREAFGAARRLLQPAAGALQADSSGAKRPIFLTEEQVSALAKSMPVYAVCPDAKPVLALNIVFFGSEPGIRKTLNATGWFEVAHSLGKSALEGAADLASGRRLERFPPFREFYIDGKSQYFNWAQSVVPVESRHHFRLWRAGKTDPLGREIWPGAADFDVRINWKKQAHESDPDIDKERDHIAATLRECPSVARLSLIDTRKIPHAAREGHADFFSDGRVLVVELKPDGPPSQTSARTAVPNAVFGAR